MLIKNFLPTVILGLAAVHGFAQTPVTPAAPATSVGSGFDYSRGDYGFTDSTEVWSVPLNVRHESGPWVLTANLSYLTLNGPATVVAGGGAPRPTAASASAFGDIYAGASYAFAAMGPDIKVSASVRVKLPTADEDRGLGTGAADYYGELVFSRTFAAATPFAVLGYRVLGDADTYALEDGVYATVGTHVRVSPSTVISPLFNWRHRIIAGGDDASEAMVMLTHDLNAQWQLTGYLLKGFTDASPEIGVGVAANWKF